MLKWKCLLSNAWRCIHGERRLVWIPSRLLSNAPELFPKSALQTNLRRMASGVMVDATISEMNNLSSTVKGLMLKVHSSDFTFKAGQWVDFYVPDPSEVTGHMKVAGYSICSTPKFLKETGSFQLAVKRSDFPPTLWIHSECRVGAKVKVCVGGDFFYDPMPIQCSDMTAQRDLLLIAGGVGINPLISIMRHAADVHSAHHQIVNQVVSTEKVFLRPPRTILLFTARLVEDLIFREEIMRLVECHDNMAASFFISRHSTDPTASISSSHPAVRISENVSINHATLVSSLRSHFNGDVSNIDCYICGPSGLLDDTNRSLLELGLLASQIKYEKWW